MIRNNVKNKLTLNNEAYYEQIMSTESFYEIIRHIFHRIEYELVINSSEADITFNIEILKNYSNPIEKLILL